MRFGDYIIRAVMEVMVTGSYSARENVDLKESKDLIKNAVFKRRRRVL